MLVFVKHSASMLCALVRPVPAKRGKHYLPFDEITYFLIPSNRSMGWGGLTGNWLVATPNGDGTLRRTYFKLRQQGDRITGTIRSTLPLYSSDKSTGGPENFTITAAMRILGGERRVTYRGKLVGDELQLTEVKAKEPGEAMVAHRGPQGGGGLPAP